MEWSLNSHLLAEGILLMQDNYFLGIPPSPCIACCSVGFSESQGQLFGRLWGRTIAAMSWEEGTFLHLQADLTLWTLKIGKKPT